MKKTLALAVLAASAILAVFGTTAARLQTADAQSVPTSTVVFGLDVYGYSIKTTAGSTQTIGTGPILDGSGVPINAADYIVGTPHKIYLNASSFSVDFRVGVKICDYQTGVECNTDWTPWASDIANGTAPVPYAPPMGPGPLDGSISNYCNQLGYGPHNRMGVVYIGAQTRALPPNTILTNVSLSLYPFEYDYHAPINGILTLSCYNSMIANAGTMISAQTLSGGGWSGGAFDHWNNASTDMFVIGLNAIETTYNAVPAAVPSNIPTSTVRNTVITNGTDGKALYVAMQNTGSSAWSSDKFADIAGTGSGTCQVDSNGGGANNCPALSDPVGTSCQINVSNWSSAIQLEHLTSKFVQGAPNPTHYNQVTTNTCTVTSICTNWIGSCSQGGCTTAISCETPQQFGGCGGIWNPTASCGTYSNAYSNTVSGNPDIPVGGVATFPLQSLTAPSATGTYTEMWQMMYPSLPSQLFGTPFSATILVVATPTVSLAASPTTITIGNSSTLTWSSSGASGGCTANSTPLDSTWPSGPIAVSGSQPVTPAATGTYVYGITCTGFLGSQATATTSVTVTESTTGTLSVSSVSSMNSAYAVTSTWSNALFYQASSTCGTTGYYDGAPCSGTAATYSNVPVGQYTMAAGNATANNQNLWALHSIESALIAAAPAPRAASFALGFLSELIHTANAATSCGYPGALGGAPCAVSSALPTVTLSITPTGSANQGNFIIFWDPIASIGVNPASVSATAMYPSSTTAAATVCNSGAPGSTLNWTATSNQSWLTVSSASGALTASGATPDVGCTNPSDSQTLTFTANSSILAPGGPYTGTVTIKGASSPNGQTVLSATITVYFTVQAPLSIIPPPPVTIPVGSSTTLSGTGGSGSYTWSSPGATPSTGSGSTYSPSYGAPGTYPVTIKDTGSGATANSTVTVVVPNCSSFAANPSTVVPPKQSTLSWSCTNAASCSITDNGSAVPGGSSVATTTGSLAVTPSPGTNTYSITCKGYGSGPYNTQSFTTTVGTQGTNIRETNP